MMNGFEKLPFNRSIANNPFIERLSTGNLIGATILPIVKIIKERVKVEFLGDFVYTYTHNLSKKYDVFMRIKKENTNKWVTIPSYDISFSGPPYEISIYDISDNYIKVLFNDGLAATYDTELYIIEFFL